MDPRIEPSQLLAVFYHDEDTVVRRHHEKGATVTLWWWTPKGFQWRQIQVSRLRARQFETQLGGQH